MKHTLTTAATATGKGRTTIFRAIKSGRLSANFENGIYEIDPAELHRVFPPFVAQEQTTQSTLEQSATAAALLEMALLKQENEFLRQQNSEFKNRFESLEKRLDTLLSLLTHNQQPPAPQSPAPPSLGSLFKRMFS